MRGLLILRKGSSPMYLDILIILIMRLCTIQFVLFVYNVDTNKLLSCLTYRTLFQIFIYYHLFSICLFYIIKNRL